MDLNLIVLAGRLAAPPETVRFDSGASFVRYLVTIRSDEPRRRLDVIPVTHWNPAPLLTDPALAPGDRLYIAGSVQRRFWDGQSNRRSRLEIVAHSVDLPADAPEVAADSEALRDG
jgi:single-stranded DNA-binding protein